MSSFFSDKVSRTSSSSSLVSSISSSNSRSESRPDALPYSVKPSSNSILTTSRSLLPDVFFFLTFATWGDLCLYVIGVLAALGTGVGPIILDLLYGQWSDAVNGSNDHEINRRARISVFGAVGIGGALTILSTTFICSLSIAARRICSRMRSEYFSCILHQDATYFQLHGSGEVSVRIVKDINTIEAGVGEKSGYIFLACGTLIAGFVSALTRNASLGGFLFTTIVVLVLLLVLSSILSREITSRNFESEGRKISYVEQIFANIRLIQAFGAESFIMRGYDMYHKRLQKLGLPKALRSGSDLSIVYLTLTASYPMAFWFGSFSIFEDNKPIDEVVVPYYNMVNSLFAASSILPHISDVLKSIMIQKRVRAEMERAPRIVLNQDDGFRYTSPSWDASIELRNVKFAYPAAPTVKVLRNISFKCPAGKTTAIVGGSGVGKSTIPSLILREYDLPTQEDNDSSGIFIAGKNIKDYNLPWLRSQFAVVTQDPQLLTGKIWENVAHGLAGTKWEYYPDGEVLETKRIRRIKDLCREALVKADAIEFVEALPNGMDTQISSNFRLSGGQTQRIAIARALVRKPRFLVFDEGTSALDTATEKRVKVALDKEQRSRRMTVIVIAHRLSTVHNADNIIVINNGELVEEGNHDYLFSQKGLYYSLVQKQSIQGGVLPRKLKKNRMSTLMRPNLDTISETWQSPSIRGPRTLVAKSYQTDPLLLSLTKSTTPTSPEPDEISTGPMVRCSLRMVCSKFIAPSAPEILFGTICSGIVGSSFVICAWIIGKVVMIIGAHVPGSDDPNMSDLTPWLLYFVTVFVVTTISAFGAGSTFEWASSRISGRIWNSLLPHLLTQEMSFYDRSSSGSLVASISSHTAHVAQGFGLVLCQILITLANFIGSVTMVFVLSWKVALVVLSPTLLLFVTGYVEARAFEKLQKQRQPHTDRLTAFCNENVDAHRTVTLFGRQKEAVKLFDSIMNDEEYAYTELFIGSFSFAATLGCVFIMGGLALWWGAQLLIREETQISVIFTSYESTLIAGFSAARAFSFLPDVARAISSAKSISMWMKRQAKIEMKSPESLDGSVYKEDRSSIIEFEDVSFCYPARPDVFVLKRINLRIENGQKIAFCGMSGSGKSTAMLLLLRIYETGNGRIFINGCDIRTLSLHHLRSKMALVPQNSVLFEGTLRENICFGLDDVSDDEIWDACKAASIDQVIKELPFGLDAPVGRKGDTFSEGQKQRIAIARAILRKPEILLLDEATSALDSSSEAAVQEALRSVAIGRTTITIAHRLSTIQNSDLICVFEEGEIVEMGTHESLMANKGTYDKLIKAQIRYLEVLKRVLRYERETM